MSTPLYTFFVNSVTAGAGVVIPGDSASCFYTFFYVIYIQAVPVAPLLSVVTLLPPALVVKSRLLLKPHHQLGMIIAVIY